MLALNISPRNGWGGKERRYCTEIGYYTEFCPEFTFMKAKSPLHRAQSSFIKIEAFALSLVNKYSVSRFSFGGICSLDPLFNEFAVPEKEGL